MSLNVMLEGGQEVHKIDHLTGELSDAIRQSARKVLEDSGLSGLVDKHARYHPVFFTTMNGNDPKITCIIHTVDAGTFAYTLAGAGLVSMATAYAEVLKQRENYQPPAVRDIR